jgi:hypothetical protein
MPVKAPPPPHNIFSVHFETLLNEALLLTAKPAPMFTLKLIKPQSYTSLTQHCEQHYNTPDYTAQTPDHTA